MNKYIDIGDKNLGYESKVNLIKNRHIQLFSILLSIVLRSEFNFLTTSSAVTLVPIFLL